MERLSVGRTVKVLYTFVKKYVTYLKLQTMDFQGFPVFFYFLKELKLQEMCEE